MDKFHMSPEINELLLHQYAFISGGRGPREELIITFPECNAETSITDEQHKKLLNYLISAALDDESRAKFTIVIDRRYSKWGIIKTLLHRICEIYPGLDLVENVYLLQPSGFFQSLHKFVFQQSTTNDVHAKLKILSSVEELYRLINPLQLTSNFGGQLHYNNAEWVKHRQLVDLLHQSCLQLTEDLKTACHRMDSADPREMTAGQLEMEISNFDKEEQQLAHRVEKSLAEAGAEIAQLKTINEEALPSAKLPPSSARHVLLVERMIGEVNTSLSEYQTRCEKHKKTLERYLKTRQLEEENNRLCAVLDGHLLFLENFNPVCDMVDEVRESSSKLEQFVLSAEADFTKSEEFYRVWQNFLAEDPDETPKVCEDEVEGDNNDRAVSPIRDNRIELSCLRFNELVSVYRKQIELCLQLHSHIEKAGKWFKEGTELLSKSIPEQSSVKKSVLEEAFDDVDIFVSSVSLNSLKDIYYAEVKTAGVKVIVDDLVSALETLLSSCNERRQKLRQLIENYEKSLMHNKVMASDIGTPTSAASTAKATVMIASDTVSETETPVATTPDRSSSLLNPDSTAMVHNIDKLYLSSRMNREFSHLKPVAPTGTIRRKRGHVIQELVATERIYTSELSSVIEGYLKQLENPELQSMIPADLQQKHCILFGNIEDIYKFHSEIFLKCLENCDQTQVGKCFTDHQSKFEMYSIYCQNKMQAEHVIEQMGNYPFFKECQRRLGHRLPLSSYILKPIQRITKYHLLLRELIKMATSQQEKDDLSEAVESMRDVVKYVNNILHQVSITGFDGNLAEQGRLLMQGSVDVMVGRRRDKKGDGRLKSHRRHVFLYEKCIIFCKKKEYLQPNEKEAYIYKNCLKTSDIGLTEAPKGGDERRFELWCQGRTDVWTIVTPNEEVKEEWIKEIKRVLFNQYLHQREVSRRSMIDRIGMTESAELKFLSTTQT